MTSGLPWFPTSAGIRQQARSCRARAERESFVSQGGKGKSGGYRIVTFYEDADMPVFLLDVYSKDSQANLSKAERNEL